MESDKEFVRISGSRDEPMNLERFCTAVGQLWRLERRCARACFRAADVDGSGRLNRHEYLLLREAFHHHPSIEAAAKMHDSIGLLQMTALFHLYDKDEDGVLSLDELRGLIRDMCAGCVALYLCVSLHPLQLPVHVCYLRDAHVEAMIRHIMSLPCLGASATPACAGVKLGDLMSVGTDERLGTALRFGACVTATEGRLAVVCRVCQGISAPGTAPDRCAAEASRW